MPEQAGGAQIIQALDPEQIADQKIRQTYGEEGTLNFYNQDRKSVVDSMKIYWSIDTMISKGKYTYFPLIENVEIK